MKKILVISFSKIHQDGRVLRQIKLLSDNNYEVTVIGFTDPMLGNIRFWQVKEKNLSFLEKFILFLILKLRLFSLYSKLEYRYLNLQKIWDSKVKGNFDLIIGNDIESLFPTVNLNNEKIPILFDAHEYFPRQKDNWLWKFIWKDYRDWLGMNYLTKTNLVCTVSKAIQNEYFNQYNVSSFLMPNAKEYFHLNPRNLEHNRVKLVHHGMAIRERKLHLILEMMNYLDDRFTLDFFLLEADPNYWDELKNSVLEHPKIKINTGLKVDQIPIVLNQYDVGIIFIPPSNFNYQNCLPNKFFESIQARLAILTGPTPDISMITKKYNLGIVSDDFNPKNVASELNKLNHEQIYQFKVNSHAASKDLSFEEYSNEFLSQIQSLINTSV